MEQERPAPEDEARQASGKSTDRRTVRHAIVSADISLPGIYMLWSLAAFN